MALEGASHSDSANVSGESDVDEQQQYDPHFNKVRKFLEPLEHRWSYVQDVLLWKEPIHSLCCFAGINCLFGYLTTDSLRHLCIVLTIMSLSLCVGEVRTRVGAILERGGIGTPVEGKSPENTVPFCGLCQKLALLWSFAALYYTKLLELKTNSSAKFFGVIFAVFVAFSFAYQYLPVAALWYFIVSAIYLWPGIRYYGIHYKVRDLMRPFYAPITTQWEYCRTRRERKKIFKEMRGEVNADSDDDFANELNLEESDDIITPSVHFPNDAELEIPDDPMVDHTSHSVPQPNMPPPDGGMVAGIQRSESPLTTERQDSHSSQDSQGLDSSASRDSSLFVEGMNFPSMSQGTESFDLDDQDFMQGLEFPDIEDGYNSSTESLHLTGTGQSNRRKRDRVGQNQQPGVTFALPAQTNSEQGSNHRNTQRQSQNMMSSSGHSSLSDDFEVLDSSEADELDLRGDGRTDSPSQLGRAVTSYLGRWLGYNN